MPECVIHILQSLLIIFDPESLISHGGLLIVFLLVYASTGLFFCFFIPTGAILFTTGIFIATGSLHYDIFTVCGLLILASVLGNLTGYWFGWKTGPLLYSRKDSRLFKKRHLKTAETFYNKYGWLALTVGLYLPIIRTFAPIVAGIVKMNWAHFIFYNITGSIAWVSSMMLGGYFLNSWVQRKFGFSLQDYIEPITIVIILVTTLPVLYKLFFTKKAIVPPPDESN